MMSGNSLMMSPLLVLASLLLISVVQSKWIQGVPASIDSNADMRLNPTDDPDINRKLAEVNGKQRDHKDGDWGLLANTNTEDTEHVGIKDRTRDSDAKYLADRRDFGGFREQLGMVDVIDCMEHYGHPLRSYKDVDACHRYLYRLKEKEKSKLRKENVDKGRTTIPSPKQTPVTKQRQGRTASPLSIQKKNCFHASSKQNRHSPRHPFQLPESNQNTRQRFFTSRPAQGAAVQDSTITLTQEQPDIDGAFQTLKNLARAGIQKNGKWVLELLTKAGF